MGFHHHINKQEELLISIDLNITLIQLQKDKQSASRELNKTVKNAGANRKQYLRSLLREYESNGQDEEAKTIQRIINAEELRELYTKLR